MRVGDLFTASSWRPSSASCSAYHNFVLTELATRKSRDRFPAQTLDDLLGYAEIIRPMVADVTELQRLHLQARRQRAVRRRAGRAARRRPRHLSVRDLQQHHGRRRRDRHRASGPRELDYVLGIVKAYATRVGSGPFPTELDNDIGQHIRDKGAEYGTVTKRPRRCGWFDAVAARRSIFNNSVTGLCVTKSRRARRAGRDPHLRRLQGQRCQPVEAPPIGAEGFGKIEAIYEDVPGLEDQHLRRDPLRRPAGAGQALSEARWRK